MRLLAIVGPTASGKTVLGEHLARMFSGEIVTADSRTVYRGMDIGTAKVHGTAVELGAYAGAVLHNGVHHWLLNLVEPDTLFTVADWKKAAMRVIHGIADREHLPIVVGGTGLYVQSVVDNLEPPPVAPNLPLRAELERQPLPDLMRLLQTYDADAAKRIDCKNSRRVIRALEVCMSSGRRFSLERRPSTALYRTLHIGISVPRAELYTRIDARVDAQVRAGLFAEAQKLVEKYGSTIPALSAIGYREVIPYLEKKCSKAAAIERIKFDSHAYARRQLTWLRRDTRIMWINRSKEAEELVRAHRGWRSESPQ